MTAEKVFQAVETGIFQSGVLVLFFSVILAFANRAD